MERKLPERKACSRCRKELPAGAFYVVRGGFGLSGWCRECQREYNNSRDRKRGAWSRFISHGRYVEPPQKKQTLVRCLETGDEFVSFVAAAAWAGCSAVSVRKAAGRGGRAMGYHWERTSAES